MKKVSVMLMMVLLLVIAAACGAKNNENKNADAPTAPASTETSSEAPAASAELTIKHMLGETKVKKNPEKVVIFDFGTLDTMDKLGINVVGVPQKNIPTYLDKYKDSKYTNVGGLKEPDFEKINEIKPDLIVISGRQSDSYDEFTKIAPTIYMGIDEKNFMPSFKHNAELIGQIFGKETEVQAELSKIEADIKTLHDKATANGKKALIVLTSGGKTSAYGPGSRFGIIHDVFGFQPADPNIDAATHGQKVALEYIAEKNPDYLFVIDRDAVVANEKGTKPAKEVIENDLVKNTNAFKDGHITYIDPNYWYLSGGGLLSVEEMVKEISAALQ